MTLSDDAVEALILLCRRSRDAGCVVRIRSVGAGTLPTVHLELDAVPRDRDVVVARGGVTVVVDRELAPATRDKVLHAEPRGEDDDRPVFLLEDLADRA